LAITFTTNESSTPRPLALRRFLMPWAKLPTESESDSLAAEPIPQLNGGDWLRGRELFFGNEASCYKCHAVRGRGGDLGPDLSNLIHRDYDSVLRDIVNPSGALNPDYIASTVALKDGRVLNGIVRTVDADHFLVRGDAAGEKSPIARSDVKKITPSPLSVMPSDIPKGLGEAKMRDLLTYLLTEPLSPAPFERKGAPPARTRAQIDAVLKSASPATSTKPLRILLVASAKDHGPSEHDYPLWQKRWTTLLGLADNVKIALATDWPTADQWNGCDVAVFYSSNAGWSAEKGKDLDAFQSRGGGLVFLHMAVNAPKDPDALAERIGLAWQGGASKFRHGPVELAITDASNPITRGVGDRVRFIDESYWGLLGDPKRIHILASGVEENESRPLIWTMEREKARVFVCILGHFTWTFDDPLFRAMVLRGIAWSARDDVDRFTSLSTLGARISN
jgi:putative heme-binding domain-containing protein